MGMALFVWVINFGVTAIVAMIAFDAFWPRREKNTPWQRDDA